MNEHTYLSDHALVAQLARVEDEIGTTATFATDDGRHSTPTCSTCWLAKWES